MGFGARLTAGCAAEGAGRAWPACRGLELDGCGRIGFRMDSEGELFCLEASTVPGMTATSLIPQAAAAEGIDFSTFCDRIVTLAKKTRGGGQ